MPLGTLKNTSLKTRMALSVSILFVLFVTAASYGVLTYFERTFKESISTQQFSMVSSLAKSIDDKLRIAQNALLAAAAAAPTDAFTNPARAQAYLDSKQSLRSIFDNGIFFIDNRGILKAESPYRANRRGRDVSFRDWAQTTLTTRKPVISYPYISTHTPGQPAIVMTVPIFDKAGKMTGMMTGSLALLGKNFLADVSNIRVGRNGYIYIVAKNRIMISHPDKSRIMKLAAPPGANRVVEQAYAGFEGTGETVTSFGVPMILSCKHLEMAPWFLGANYPMAEAYEPLLRARHYFFIAIATGTGMLLLLTWLIMKRMMAPLIAMTRHVESMTEKSGQDRIVPVNTGDEIGVLGWAFNAMIKAMDVQQESLREREEKFRLLADFTADWEYWIDPDARLVYCSPACMAITGYSTEEFMDDPELLIRIVHPDDREPFRQHLDMRQHQAVLESQSVYQSEFRIMTRQGELRWLSHMCRPIIGDDGAYRGHRASNRDITGRKQAEEVLQEQTRLLEHEARERRLAQEALTQEQRQLEALNDSLEERIRAAVAELRHKDQMLIQQGRQAAMGEMISNIAHQWRQPLNNIGLIVQNLRTSYEYNELNWEEMQRQAAKAMETIMFMSRTINDFSNFFRQDKEKQEFSVNAVIAKTMEFVSAAFSASRVALEIEEETVITAFGYPNEFSQVVLNILNNARDVLVERRPAGPRVRIRLYRQEGCAVVTVTDNGGGIPHEVLPKVFDPYFSTKEPGKGTGIGLYMSKVIIEQNMGGTLSAHNVDNGAEFRIVTPCAVRANAPAAVLTAC